MEMACVIVMDTLQQLMKMETYGVPIVVGSVVST